MMKQYLNIISWVLTTLFFGIIAIIALFYYVPKQYDLYKNGALTYGTVLESKGDTKSVLEGENRKFILISNLKVSYAGTEKIFESTNFLADGSKIEIYYSKNNPDNAILVKAGTPYPSLFAALNEDDILLTLFIFSLFTFFCARYTLIDFKRLKSSKETTPYPDPNSWRL